MGWPAADSMTHHCGYAYKIEEDGQTVDRIEPDGGALITANVATLTFAEDNSSANFTCINPNCGDEGYSTNVFIPNPNFET
jgi:hypothetical protein